jgi:methionyl-tRNA synthetase
MFFENLTRQRPRNHQYFQFSEEEMRMAAAGTKTLHAAKYQSFDLHWNKLSQCWQPDPCFGAGSADLQGHLHGILDEHLDGKLFFCTSDQKWIILVTETFIRQWKNVSDEEIRSAGSVSKDHFAKAVFSGTVPGEEDWIIFFRFRRINHSFTGRKLKYITTPIYYPSGDPHAGHAHTSVMADIIKRWNLLQGNWVAMSTGVDENGQKMQQKIRESGLSAQEYLEFRNKQFYTLFNDLHVDFNHFVRTSLPDEHLNSVTAALQQVWEQNGFVKTEYAGLYCEGCEMFKTAADLDENGYCRDHKKKPVQVTETNYLFPLEPHREWLRQHILENPRWIQPESVRNEMLNLLEDELPPLCISRPKTRVQHGIELPFDRDDVTYVWFDALLNYISTLGYCNFDAAKKQYWQNSCHLIGKDIAKPHCIYWPIMLHVLGIEPVGSVWAHGHWLGEDNRKMSKDRGNVVDPVRVIEIFGPEVFRFYLAKNMGSTDSPMGYELIRQCCNADLVNNIGNVFFRVMTLADRNLGGVVPAISELDENSRIFLEDICAQVKETATAEPTLFKIRDYAVLITEISTKLNGFLSERKPWKLEGEEQKSVLICALETLRLMWQLAVPVMPETAEKALAEMGVNPGVDLVPRIFKAGHKLGKGFIAFPKIDKLEI